MVAHIGGEPAGTHPDLAVELSEIFLFQSLSAPERFSSLLTAEHVFEAEMCGCREGDIGNACFMVANGAVDVTRGGHTAHDA